MTAEFTPQQVRHMFYEREHEACFYCRRGLSWQLRGSMLAGGWSVHHRRGRGKQTVSYPHGVVLCGTGTTGCHGWVTEHPALAREYGLSLSRLATTDEFQPAAVRIRDEAGRWWLLTESGRAVEVEEGIPS